MATRIAAAVAGGGGSAVALPTLISGVNPGPVDTTQPKRSSVASAPDFLIAGTSKNAAGVALAGCTVHLFVTATDTLLDVQVSDANGAYTFPSVLPGYTHYLVAYLAGSPDVSGTTLNTLTGS